MQLTMLSRDFIVAQGNFNRLAAALLCQLPRSFSVAGGLTNPSSADAVRSVIRGGNIHMEQTRLLVTVINGVPLVVGQSCRYRAPGWGIWESCSIERIDGGQVILQVTRIPGAQGVLSVNISSLSESSLML